MNSHSQHATPTEAELLEMTSRQVVPGNLAQEAQSLQAAYAKFSVLLENETQITPENSLISIILRTAAPAESPSSWNSVLALAIALLLFASFAVWHLPQERNWQQVALSQGEKASPSLTWNDDWDSQTDYYNSLLMHSHVSQLSLTDTAAQWLQSSLLEEQSQIEAESM